MTHPEDIKDTSKALFSEGAWHIMPGDLYSDKFVAYDYPHDSIIYHQCRNYWEKNKNSEIWIPPVVYRVSLAEMNIPCSSCGEVCPEGLQGLWTLHNYNSLQQKDL